MTDLFAGSRIEIRQQTRPRIQVEQPSHGSTNVYAPAAEWRARLAALEADVDNRVADLEAFLDESVIDGKVEAEVTAQAAGHTPGTELGYAESTSGGTTTAVFSSLTLVTQLTMVVTGQGRPVDIEWYMPLFYHSVAGTPVYGVMLTQIVGSGTNVYEQVVVHRSPVTNGSNPYYVKRRKVLAEGTDYTVAFYVAGSAVGTTSFGATGGLQRMWAGVTSR